MQHRACVSVYTRKHRMDKGIALATAYSQQRGAMIAFLWAVAGWLAPRHLVWWLLLLQVKFADPTGNHLSPAGEYNLRLGVMKELHPDLIATYQGEGLGG